MLDDHQVFLRLAVALAIGLLFGVERGWQERGVAEGQRIAGVRTYTLIGLLGGVAGLLASQVGGLALGLIFLGLVGLLTAAHALDAERRADVSVTGLVAALLTFLLGALAALGELAGSAAAAVIATLLLGAKPALHRWVGALEQKDLRAGLTLLLISVVLLPLLPNRGFGPWAAFNPYATWWMVVLIASVSFAGYYAIRLVGCRRGTLLTGLFGGLASSTALTLHFARLARAEAGLTPMLATGILVACGTMLPRLLLVAAVLNPALLRPLLAPILAMAGIVYAAAALYWVTQPRAPQETTALLTNPLELRSAMGFGLLLALVVLLAKALEAWLGTRGLLLLAAVSGIADVDAITLALARMNLADLALSTTVAGIVIAASVNTLAKGLIATAIGGPALGRRVVLPLLAASLVGLALAWWGR